MTGEGGPGGAGSETRAVLLVSHGTVDDLDDLDAFATAIRRGRPAPPELVAELRHRYQAIGGRSPLDAINAELARKLQGMLRVPVRTASRLWKPFVKDVLGELGRTGVTRVAIVPLAQHSAHVYAEDAQKAAEGSGIAVDCAGNWGRSALLCEAFAARVRIALSRTKGKPVTVIMTAHSLPRAVVAAGDPYEREVTAAANAVTAAASGSGDGVRWRLAFQSQGFGAKPGEWLGSTLGEALDEAKVAGSAAVVIAPIGFLADHVETLYDLDVEAAALARARGLELVRAASLNADDDLVAAVAEVTRPLLRKGH